MVTEQKRGSFRGFQIRVRSSETRWIRSEVAGDEWDPCPVHRDRVRVGKCSESFGAPSIRQPLMWEGSFTPFISAPRMDHLLFLPMAWTSTHPWHREASQLIAAARCPTACHAFLPPAPFAATFSRRPR